MGGGLRLFAKSTPLVVALATISWAGTSNYWRLMKSLGDIRPAPAPDETLSMLHAISGNGDNGRHQQHRGVIRGSLRARKANDKSLVAGGNVNNIQGDGQVQLISGDKTANDQNKRGDKAVRKLNIPKGFRLMGAHVPTHSDMPSRHSKEILETLVKQFDSAPSDCPAVADNGNESPQSDSNAFSKLDGKYHSLWGKHVLSKSTRSIFGVDKVYIVHYTPLTNRRATMVNRTKQVFGDDCFETNFVSFIDALDREGLSKEDMTTLTGEEKFTGKSTGVMSVAAKHYNAYYDALKNSYGVVAILEDDVFFNENFGENLSKVVCAAAATGDDWSSIFLATPHPQFKCEPVNRELCLQTDNGSNGAVAYLMSGTGCRMMIESLPTQSASDAKINEIWIQHGGSFITHGVNQNLAKEDRVDLMSTHNSRPLDY